MRPYYLLALPAAALLATPLMARPGGGYGGGWGGDPWGPSYGERSYIRSRQPGPAEGKVEVTRFVADSQAAALLAKGGVSVVAAPTGGGVDDVELRTYEAAVIDRLAAVGYQTATTTDAASQTAELRVTHDTVVPEEASHKPVSGEMTMGVSNRGSMLGMAVNIDMTKPLKAMIGTRLEARIRDKATGAVLWEGRADITTREGSAKWTDGVIATKLAQALFADFPGRSGETKTALR
ncbi:MAG: hypothetical protein ABI673_11005 [Novosphingobium sp.]